MVGITALDGRSNPPRALFLTAACAFESLAAVAAEPQAIAGWFTVCCVLEAVSAWYTGCYLHSAMLRRKSSVLPVCLIGACLVGCAPRTRRDVGTGLAATGGLTGLVGIGVSLGCAPFQSDDDPTTSSCDNDGLEPNPEVGLPVIGVGIAIALIGGIVYGSGEDMTPAPPPSETNDPPPSEYLY